MQKFYRKLPTESSVERIESQEQPKGLSAIPEHFSAQKAQTPKQERAAWAFAPGVYMEK